MEFFSAQDASWYALPREGLLPLDYMDTASLLMNDWSYEYVIIADEKLIIWIRHHCWRTTDHMNTSSLLMNDWSYEYVIIYDERLQNLGLCSAPIYIVFDEAGGSIAFQICYTGPRFLWFHLNDDSIKLPCTSSIRNWRLTLTYIRQRREYQPGSPRRIKVRWNTSEDTPTITSWYTFIYINDILWQSNNRSLLCSG